MGIFLAEKDLPGLKQYRYSSIDQSLVSKYVLKPFYVRFVELFPLWVAPNLITLSGIAFTGTGALMAAYFNPHFNQESPSWVYFAYGLQLFLYQTFDACDGLQARRTGSSSPLGELFDHTIDAINTTIGVINFAATANYHPWVIIYSEFVCTLNFMLSTWEEFHTGTLFLSFFSGPVEGVLLLISAEFLTGIYGTQIWNTPLWGPVKAKHFQTVFLSIGLLFNIYAAVKNVQKVVASNDDTEKESKQLQIQGLYPYASFWIGTVVWLLACPHLVQNQLWPVMLNIGLAVAFQVGRVILAHITAQPLLPKRDIQSFLPWLSLAAHLVIPRIFDTVATSVDIACVWLCLGLNLGVYGSFVTEIITEITGYLGIECLKIKTKKD